MTLPVAPGVLVGLRALSGGHSRWSTSMREAAPEPASPPKKIAEAFVDTDPAPLRSFSADPEAESSNTATSAARVNVRSTRMSANSESILPKSTVLRILKQLDQICGPDTPKNTGRRMKRAPRVMRAASIAEHRLRGAALDPESGALIQQLD